MRALLISPIEGLEVGKTYNIEIAEGVKESELSIYLLPNRSIAHSWYENDNELFNFWFIFQEIPEQIKGKIQYGLGQWVYDIGSAQDSQSIVNGVIGVLEGKE